MNAPDCLRTFFETVWMDNTDEEALAVWSHLASGGSTYADDMLACLDAAVADPPDDLVEVMAECGWIYLAHTAQDDSRADPSGDPAPYSFAEHVDWLATMTERFRVRLAEVRAAATGAEPGSSS